jgi:hypothetical protein
VRIFDLLEELERVVDAIDAELERGDIPGAELDGGAAVRGKRARAGEREVRFVFALAEGSCGKGKEEEGSNQHDGMPFRRLGHAENVAPQPWEVNVRR